MNIFRPPKGPPWLIADIFCYTLYISANVSKMISTNLGVLILNVLAEDSHIAGIIVAFLALQTRPLGVGRRKEGLSVHPSPGSGIRG